MSALSSVEVRGSGASWVVLLDGRAVGKPANAFDKACIKANRLERQLARRARPCLCCRAPFMAEGRHNRLCPACTAFASGALV